MKPLQIREQQHVDALCDLRRVLLCVVRHLGQVSRSGRGLPRRRTKIQEAMRVFEGNPSLSTREVAKRVGCSPSLLYRSPAFQRFYETFVREARSGTKFNGNCDGVEKEEEVA